MWCKGEIKDVNYETKDLKVCFVYPGCDKKMIKIRKFDSEEFRRIVDVAR